MFQIRSTCFSYFYQKTENDKLKTGQTIQNWKTCMPLGLLFEQRNSKTMKKGQLITGRILWCYIHPTLVSRSNWRLWIKYFCDYEIFNCRRLICNVDVCLKCRFCFPIRMVFKTLWKNLTDTEPVKNRRSWTLVKGKKNRCLYMCTLRS